MRFASLASVLVLLLYGRAQADTLQIKTSYGNGADCGISGDNGIDNPNMGASTTAAARYAGTAPPLTNVRNQKIYLRFDLSQLVPGSISAASLTVVPNNTDTSAGTARVKGLTNGHPGELWGETVITWTNAPGMSGASAANGNGVDYVVATDWVALPNWTFTSVTAGTSKTYAPGAAFINFLNTKSNGSVTIMLDGYTGTVVDSVSIRTKEYDSTNTPYLTLTATPRASLSLASAPNPSVVGSDAVFTATVVTNSLTAGDATGTVVFKDGATPLSTNTLSGGVAAYTNHSLAQGSHTVWAEYSGDSIYLPSTNYGVQLVTANLPPTTTALGSAPNPSLAGRNVIFTATVRTNGVAAGDATGAVVFKEGLSALSTNAVSGGVATYTNTSFGPGAHGLTAEYSGDAQYAGSFSGTVTQIVQAATTLALTPSSNPSTVSNNLTLTATVQTNGAPAGGAGGTVVFKEGGTPLWTTNVTGGVAVFTTSGLAVGSHALTAEYSGDAFYLPSTNSPALTQVVYPQILIKTVLGQGADATAAEDAHADNSSGTGTIAYRFTNPSGTTGDRHQSTILRFDLSQIAPGSISSATLNLVNWRNANTPANPVRIYGLNDGNARENWDEYGTSYTANNIPGFRSDSATTDLDLGTDPIDTNAVTVLNGSYSLGTPAKGSASAVLNGGAFLTWLKADTNGLVTVILDPYRSDTAAVNLTVFGSKDTTALEGGSPVGAPGDFAAYLVLGANVRAVPTTTALASSGSPSTLGNNVTFTATVQTNGVTASNAGGTLVFKAGAVGLGTAPVTGGVASLTTSAVPFGTNLVTAVYVGDANHLGSTSLAVEQVVPLATTTVIAAVGNNPIVVGDTATFQADVQTNGVTAGDAGGTMVFKEGATLLDSIPVSNGQASYNLNTLTPGWHYLTAQYSGDGVYLASTSSVPAAQAVSSLTQTATTLTLASSLNPSTNGDSVTFTATVHTNFGVDVAVGAGGTVVFKDGAVTLGSRGALNGVASFSTTALAAGAHALTAEYSGNATYGPSPAALAQVVAQPSLPNTPTSISYSVGGGSLTLSWPASYLGWILQGQTNALEVGLGANWADLAGTESVTSTNLPLGPGNPAVFYRLRHP